VNDLSNKPSLQVLQFLVQNVRLCVDLSYVKKVIPLTAVEEVPGGPSCLVGLLNVAGTSLPAFDLGLQLDLPRTSVYTVDTPIVICFDDEHEAGIIVDKIIGLETIENKDLQMREEFNKPNSPFLAAVTINSELFLVINMSSLLSMNVTLGPTPLSINKNVMKMATLKNE
jgi:purine-binding chemotaxis protein CheW